MSPSWHLVYLTICDCAELLGFDGSLSLKIWRDCWPFCLSISFVLSLQKKASLLLTSDLLSLAIWNPFFALSLCDLGSKDKSEAWLKSYLGISWSKMIQTWVNYFKVGQNNCCIGKDWRLSLKTFMISTPNLTFVEERGCVSHGCGDEVKLWKLHVGGDVDPSALRPPVEQVVVRVAN